MPVVLGGKGTPFVPPTEEELATEDDEVLITEDNEPISGDNL